MSTLFVPKLNPSLIKVSAVRALIGKLFRRKINPLRGKIDKLLTGKI